MGCKKQCRPFGGKIIIFKKKDRKKCPVTDETSQSFALGNPTAYIDTPSGELHLLQGILTSPFYLFDIFVII
ncbi:MAG: hypothetical protein UHM23_04800 [Clostridia bacterium]|nr:hypothetical protein [Clostridia bacterium]